MTCTLPKHARAERTHLLIRGHSVALDAELASPYADGIRMLLHAATHSADRFPRAFELQCTRHELATLEWPKLKARWRAR